MSQKTKQQLNLSDDEVFETINNMPRKYVLSKVMGIFWDKLEEHFKANRTIDKNTPGGMYPSEQNLRAMGSLYYTIMLMKEEYDITDPTLLNKDYIPPTPIRTECNQQNETLQATQESSAQSFFKRGRFGRKR